MSLSLPPFWSSWLAWPKPPPAPDASGVFSSFLDVSRRQARRLAQPAELRIDVDPPDATIEQELSALHQRLHSPGDALHGLPSTPLPGHPGRGVEGTTVFNRLVELNRRADRHLRAPHSRYAPAYQRRGLATAVYRWALDGGQCLVSGARQSAGAHALWQRLGRDYPQGYVCLQHKTPCYLGRQVDARVQEALATRRLLLGRGWTLARLAAATGMLSA